MQNRVSIRNRCRYVGKKKQSSRLGVTKFVRKEWQSAVYLLLLEPVICEVCLLCIAHVCMRCAAGCVKVRILGLGANSGVGAYALMPEASVAEIAMFHEVPEM